MAEEGDERGLAAVLGSDDKDAAISDQYEMVTQDMEGWFAYLNGVGSFLRRILRGLLMLTGTVEEA